MGVLMILGALVTIAQSFLQTGHAPDGLPLLIGTIIGGVGLTKARDDDKTSEETGAKAREAERVRQELNR